MKKLKIISGLMLVLSMQAYAGGVEDDPMLTKVMGSVEAHNGGDKSWNINAWYGKDLSKFWIKSEGETVNGKVEESELQLLYSKAISPFWDVQFGLRNDSGPDDPTRTWGVVTAKGVAPYLFEVDTSLFIGSSGKMAVRLDAEYEYMLSQKLVLSPEIELNIHSKNDEAVGTGSGVSNINVGIGLSYDITREFAPYIGFNWGKKYGNTARFAGSEGEDIEDAQLVTGVRFWF